MPLVVTAPASISVAFVVFGQRERPTESQRSNRRRPRYRRPSMVAAMNAEASISFLEATLNALTAHIAVVDATGEIVLTNKAYRDFAECNGIPAVLVSEKVNYLTVCDSAQGNDSEYAHACAQGLRDVLAGRLPSFGMEYPCHSLHEQRWFRLSATLSSVEDRRLAVVTHQDVTERKKAEKAQRDALDRLERLSNQVPGALYQFQLFPDGTMAIPYASEGIKNIYATSPEQIRHDAAPVFENIHPDDVPLVKTSIQESARTLEIWSNQHRVQSSDGVSYWLEGEATPNVELDGSILWHGYIHDITEQKNSAENLELANQKMANAQVKLEALVDGSINLLVRATESRDPYTAGHQQGVALIASAIAEEMGLPVAKIAGLKLAAKVHDLGKIGIPSDILSKPTTLKKPELDLLQMHAKTGYDILKDMEFPWPIAEMVYQHHERMDGSGYPRGLKGDEILLEARILGVADTVEAMTSHRPYRASLGIDRALAEIDGNRGVLYDPAIADACLRLFRERGYEMVSE